MEKRVVFSVLTTVLCNCVLCHDRPVRPAMCRSLGISRHYCASNKICAFVGLQCNNCIKLHRMDNVKKKTKNLHRSLGFHICSGVIFAFLSVGKVRYWIKYFTPHVQNTFQINFLLQSEHSALNVNLTVLQKQIACLALRNTKYVYKLRVKNTKFLVLNNNNNTFALLNMQCLRH